MNAKASRLAPALGSGLVSRQIGTYLRHAVALVALGELRDQLPQDHCHRVVLVDRLLLRDDAGVGRHEEGQGCRERAALDAGQADVLGGRLSQAVAEEVPGGEGLEVFDLLHVDLLVLEAGSSALRY